MKPYGVTGVTLGVKGRQSVSFLVCRLPTDAADLLGTKFMEASGATIDFQCGKICLPTSAERPQRTVIRLQGVLHLRSLRG
jgi:hypothetical protein